MKNITSQEDIELCKTFLRIYRIKFNENDCLHISLKKFLERNSEKLKAWTPSYTKKIMEILNSKYIEGTEY